MDNKGFIIIIVFVAIMLLVSFLLSGFSGFTSDNDDSSNSYSSSSSDPNAFVFVDDSGNTHEMHIPEENIINCTATLNL